MHSISWGCPKIVRHSDPVSLLISTFGINLLLGCKSHDQIIHYRTAKVSKHKRQFFVCVFLDKFVQLDPEGISCSLTCMMSYHMFQIRPVRCLLYCCPIGCSMYVVAPDTHDAPSNVFYMLSHPIRYFVHVVPSDQILYLCCPIRSDTLLLLSHPIKYFVHVVPSDQILCSCCPIRSDTLFVLSHWTSDAC